MPFDSLPVTNPAIEALREGRARIERGWCQHHLNDPATGAVCVIGAIHLLRSANNIKSAALGFICHARDGAAHIVEWNDTPSRTQADVIALYDRAIELAVAEELERADAAV